MIQLTKRAINYIEEHLTEKITLEEIAKEVNTSIRTLQRTFKMITKYSVSEYIKKRIMSLVVEELINTNNKISDIAYKYGYQNPESLSKMFYKKFSIYPEEYRKKGKRDYIFEEINTSKMYDEKQYVLNDYYDVENEEMLLFGMKKDFCDISCENIYEAEDNLHKLLNENKVKVNEIFEIYYASENEEYYSYGIFLEDKDISKFSNEIFCFKIPKTKWLVCKGKSKISYDEAKTLTLISIASNISKDIYDDYGFYQDFEFSEKYKITNICINKGFDNKKQEYHCEVWIPIKEDFFIETNCTTCGSCCWCEIYEKKSLEELLKKYPKGCSNFKYSFNEYCKNEKIRESKSSEIFKDKIFCKLISF